MRVFDHYIENDVFQSIKELFNSYIDYFDINTLVEQK